MLSSVLVMGALALTCRAAVCEVRETVPTNEHMCYHVRGELEEVVLRNVPRTKWVLEEPANCKSQFPCFGVIKEVVEVEKVHEKVSVCQLDSLWRRPRPIQEMFHGVTLILSPWYFQAKNYSDQLLCIWNVSCPTDHTLFVNSTSIVLRSSDEVTFSDGCSGEYVEVQWGGGRVVRCAEQQGPWLENYVFPQEIKVIFRSAHMGGSSGTGLRLDTVCYRMAPAEDNCSTHNHSGGQDHKLPEFRTAEKEQLTQALALHFDLHLLMDTCSRGVGECGSFYSHHSQPSLVSALEQLATGPTSCNPLIHSLVFRTLQMYGYH